MMPRFRTVFSWGILVGLVVRLAATEVPERFALHGDLITPEGIVADGVVVVAGARIESVGRMPAPAGVRVVETDGVICPGLIDLHNHLTWNVFPRWHSGRKFPNRYEWQILPEYLMALAGPHATLIDEGLGPAMARYAEVKAVAGGATSLAGLYPGDLDPAFKPPYHGLMRMLDIGSGFYPEGTPDAVGYEVFPLVLSEAEAEKMRVGLKNGTIKSLLIHLGEGNPHDASSMLEYRILKARGLLLPGVTFIHGTALHEEQFEEMARLGVGLVWSPRSNFELYGAGADVVAAKRAGVRIALAPDWSPTGSDGVLQELAYAAVWNATQAKPPFSDADLVNMATREAARLAVVDRQVGALKAGLLADMLVIKKGDGDAWHALVHAGPAAVKLVMVGGRPVYGEKAIVESLAPQQGWTSLIVAGVAKEVALPVDPKLGDWAALTKTLEAAMAGVGTHLGPIAGE
jgi:5-methylthioadenosine/S-adenosylhomocysteine deaminase